MQTYSEAFDTGVAASNLVASVEALLCLSKRLRLQAIAAESTAMPPAWAPAPAAPASTAGDDTAME